MSDPTILTPNAQGLAGVSLFGQCEEAGRAANAAFAELHTRYKSIEELAGALVKGETAAVRKLLEIPDAFEADPAVPDPTVAAVTDSEVESRALVALFQLHFEASDACGTGVLWCQKMIMLAQQAQVQRDLAVDQIMGMARSGQASAQQWTALAGKIEAMIREYLVKRGVEFVEFVKPTFPQPQAAPQGTGGYGAPN